MKKENNQSNHLFERGTLVLAQLVTRRVLLPRRHGGATHGGTSERQRLVLFDGRRREPKVKIARFILEVWLNGERHAEVVAEEILRRRLAHVDAHPGASALLQPSTFFYVHLGVHLLSQVVLGRTLQFHRSNHPREHNLEVGRRRLKRENKTSNQQNSSMYVCLERGANNPPRAGGNKKSQHSWLEKAFIS